MYYVPHICNILGRMAKQIWTKPNHGIVTYTRQLHTTDMALSWQRQSGQLEFPTTLGIPSEALHQWLQRFTSAHEERVVYSCINIILPLLRSPRRLLIFIFRKTVVATKTRVALKFVKLLETTLYCRTNASRARSSLEVAPRDLHFAKMRFCGRSLEATSQDPLESTSFANGLCPSSLLLWVCNEGFAPWQLE